MVPKEEYQISTTAKISSAATTDVEDDEKILDCREAVSSTYSRTYRSVCSTF